jgi:hypothetical protein
MSATAGSISPTSSGSSTASNLSLRRRPGLRLGITERLKFVDATGHAEDLERYRARAHAMKNNRIRLVTDRPHQVVEVHAPSASTVKMAGVTVEYGLLAPVMGS